MTLANVAGSCAAGISLSASNQTDEDPQRPIVVLIFDADPARARTIARLIVATGAQMHVISVEDAARLRDAAGDVAVVALGSPAQTQETFCLTLKRLRDRGVAVLAYENALLTWPLAERARLLLAGATRLLDSAAPGFASELGDRVSEAAQVILRRRRDRRELGAQMRTCGIVGDSAAMRGVFEWVARISQFSDFCVLLAGETGTGKDLLARALHRLDPRRREGPFVAVNCAAVAKTLSESELFGHRRGAFTGAERDRRGLVRAADGGVLFLDEIGELDLDVQGKLLHVLQDGRVLGVGEERDTTVDVRIVAATHRDLRQMVTEGRFREDLLHRLQVLSVEVPPLRQRREDLFPLVQRFLEKYGVLARGRQLTAGPDFFEALEKVELRGNVRQLENIVRRAVAKKDDDAPLGLSDLPPELWQGLAAAQPVAVDDDAAPAPEDPVGASGFSLGRALADHERLLIERAVERAHGNQSEAARLLGITPRSVYTKLRKHQLDARRPDSRQKG